MRSGWVTVVGMLGGAACGSVGLEDAKSDGSNGAALLLPEGDIDFGSVSPSIRRPVSASQQVESVGIDPITVEDAWIDGDDAGVFSLGGAQFPKRIDPGDVVAFEVKFEPDARDHFHGTLHVLLEDTAQITRNVLGWGCRDDDENAVCDDVE